MKMLQTGDKCPICGQSIQTKDPNKLIFLSAMAWWDEQNIDCEPDLCGPFLCKATNADKIRSLPDEDLAGIIMCPGVEFGEPVCREIDDGPDLPDADCGKCCHDRMRAPYKGWEAE